MFSACFFFRPSYVAFKDYVTEWLILSLNIYNRRNNHCRFNSLTVNYFVCLQISPAFFLFFRAAFYASTPGSLAKLRAPTRRDIAKKEIGQSSRMKTAYTHCQCTPRDTASANTTFGAFYIVRVPAGFKFYHLV